MPDAAAHLTRDALGAIEFSQLAPLKGLIKQFFSDQAWTAADDRKLADLMGPGEGWWSYVLGDAFDLGFGWRDGEFRIALSTLASDTAPASADAGDHPIEDTAKAEPLADAFATTVVPEATPEYPVDTDHFTDATPTLSVAVPLTVSDPSEVDTIV